MQQARFRDDAAFERSSLPRPVQLTLDLLEALNRGAISYCYWKSSRRLHRAMSGESDLDLLVARRDQHEAARILIEHGFKCFPAVPGHDHPAMSSHLGYDEPSGRIVHVHLHTQLVTGEQLLKSYRLPWEAVILPLCVWHPTFPVRVLDPASESVLLVVRASLETGALRSASPRNARLTREKFALDREELARRVPRLAFHERASTLVGEDVSRELARPFYGERSVGDRTIARVLRKRLAPYRIYNRVEAGARTTWSFALSALGLLNRRYLHRPRPSRRRCPGGGCVVAIVGVDGSGKSTTVANVCRWLGGEVDVIPMYFGTGAGRPSLLLLPFKLLVPLATVLVKAKPRGASHGRISNEPPGLFYSALLTVWATVVALEKRMKLVAARRGASRGLVVVADRYPQNQIARFNDGPLLPRATYAPSWLRRFEARAYARAHAMPPDLVIKLQVSAETADRREPEMDRALIRERITALERLSFPGAHVVCVDAEQPLSEVLRLVRHEIWKLL